MPSNPWTHEHELAMFHAVNKNGKFDSNAIAVELGSGFTEAGVRQKYYKLKKEADALLGGLNPASGPATPTTATTSAAKGSKGKATGTKSTASKRKKAISAEAEDDGDAIETPSKKSKKTTAKVVKEEPLDADLDDDTINVVKEERNDSNGHALEKAGKDEGSSDAAVADGDEA